MIDTRETIDLYGDAPNGEPIEMTVKANWECLWRQKQLLHEVADWNRPLDDEVKGLLGGLVNFLDTITDAARDAGVWQYPHEREAEEEVENAHGFHTPPGDWPNADRDPELYLPSYVEYPDYPDEPDGEARSFDPVEDDPQAIADDLSDEGERIRALQAEEGV
jgi:hypothetical protein